MQRRVTITVTEEVYRGLHEWIARGERSRFIEGLIRPYVMDVEPLEEAYREASLDEQAEQEALEWIEADLDEVPK